MKLYPKVWAICFLLILGWSALLSMRYHAGLVQLQHSNRSVAAMVQAGRQFEPTVFPSEQVLWLKPHEIAFEGQKYDLKEWQIIGDTLFTLAYRDTRETHLELKLKEEAESNQEAISNSSNLLIYICPELFHIPEAMIVENNQSFISEFILPLNSGKDVWNPPQS